jgi:hypothetical protein
MKRSRIAVALALLALFAALTGAAWAVKAGNSPRVDGVDTVVVTDPADGPATTQELFRIGGVSVGGRCLVESSGRVEYMLTVTNQTTHSVLLATDFGSQQLAPDELEAVIATEADTGSGPTAHETHFAIIDREGSSATALGGASGHPATGQCVFTSQARG